MSSAGTNDLPKSEVTAASIASRLGHVSLGMDSLAIADFEQTQQKPIPAATKAQPRTRQETPRICTNDLDFSIKT